MWNKPTSDRLATLPAIERVDDKPPGDLIVHLHFFIGSWDWYAVAFDGKDTFFGFAIDMNHPHDAEWGYFSLAELDDISIVGIEVDCEDDWAFPPRPAKEIPKIKKNSSIL